MATRKLVATKDLRFGLAIGVFLIAIQHPVLLAILGIATVIVLLDDGS